MMGLNKAPTDRDSAGTYPTSQRNVPVSDGIRLASTLMSTTALVSPSMTSLPPPPSVPYSNSTLSSVPTAIAESEPRPTSVHRASVTSIESLQTILGPGETFIAKFVEPVLQGVRLLVFFGTSRLCRLANQLFFTVVKGSYNANGCISTLKAAGML